MNASRTVVWVSLLIAGLLGNTAGAVNMETVPVGNPGNAAEVSGGVVDGLDYGPTRTCGAVGYTYQIGKFEVTAGQYAEFLNAVARTDTYGLYNTYMDYDAYPNWLGCNIKRTGSAGSFTYSVASGWASRPVNYVSWGDAARFANWLHNGQPMGAQGLSTTEDGAYFLNGATTDAQLVAVNRETDWQWAIASEDEWYKAAYHKNDGVTGNYFDYPTSSDSLPSNQLIDPDPGNNATYADHPYNFTIGDPYLRTEVGAHENSESPYGTFDQGGNVWEWNEAVLYGSARGLRGGSFHSNNLSLLASSADYSADPTGEHDHNGFRVVEVPEPATAGLFLLGGLLVARRRRAPR